MLPNKTNQSVSPRWSDPSYSHHGNRFQGEGSKKVMSTVTTAAATAAARKWDKEAALMVQLLRKQQLLKQQLHHTQSTLTRTDDTGIQSPLTITGAAKMELNRPATFLDGLYDREKLFDSKNSHYVNLRILRKGIAENTGTSTMEVGRPTSLLAGLYDKEKLWDSKNNHYVNLRVLRRDMDVLRGGLDSRNSPSTDRPDPRSTVTHRKSSSSLTSSYNNEDYKDEICHDTTLTVTGVGNNCQSLCKSHSNGMIGAGLRGQEICPADSSVNNNKKISCSPKDVLPSTSTSNSCHGYERSAMKKYDETNPDHIRHLDSYKQTKISVKKTGDNTRCNSGLHGYCNKTKHKPRNSLSCFSCFSKKTVTEGKIKMFGGNFDQNKFCIKYLLLCNNFIELVLQVVHVLNVTFLSLTSIDCYFFFVCKNSA